jgi:outer membrane protein assembly factor BamB
VAWTQWRGPTRNGLVDWLPTRLAPQAAIVWERKLSNQGLGGIAATDDYVIVGDRDAADAHDVFRCLAASDGHEVWALRYPARGKLDYGNSPRATPLIDGERVFLLGALGDLHCVSLASGQVIWSKRLRQDFGQTNLPAWGYCSSPLIADGRLIVNPGAKDCSLAALEPSTGEAVWKTPGAPAAFGSFILAEVAGRRQIIGHDQNSLGGWDAADGRRLWRLAPPRPNDFNVPTPVQVDDTLMVATENNGTRAFRFDAHGRIDPKPFAENADLCPDSHSPIVIGRRLFGVWDGLHCLDTSDGLKAHWTASDDAFGDYATLLGCRQRVLMTTIHGELLLIDAQSPNYRLIGRSKLFQDDSGVYAHPALVGSRLFVRGSTSICRVDLAAEQ